MKKIMTAGMALVLLGVLSSCQESLRQDQILPDQQINYNEPQAEGAMTVQTGTEDMDVSSVTATQSAQSGSEEKMETAQPQTDILQPQRSAVPASPDDLAKAEEAYRTGDVSLCNQITDENLKRQCNTELSAEETPPQEESVSIVTPGTP